MDEVPCKGCGAPMVFIETPAGKTAPVDAKPIKVWVGHGDTWLLMDGYVPHHATCPKAEQFRRKR